jgi:hypothetical protein
MYIILERVFGVNKDIVEINVTEFVQVIKKGVIYELLPRSRGISKSFPEDFIFIYSVAYIKNHKLFGIWIYPNFIENLLYSSTDPC